MPRGRGPIYRKHFTTVKIKKWSCNVCTGRRRRVMNHRQAKFHGGSAKHCSKAETTTFFKHPGNFAAVEVSKWQCNICDNRRGRRGRPMTRKLAKLHEVSSEHSSKVAATFFKHPEIFKYVGNGGWLCQICETDAMTIKKAKAHEIRCQKVGAAENEEAESMHEYDNEDEEEGDDDDDDEDDDDDGDDGDDSDSDAAFVENFLRSQDVDASHRRRMRSFYKMPTDQKIQKIREVIDVIRDRCGQ